MVTMVMTVTVAKAKNFDSKIGTQATIVREPQLLETFTLN